MNTILNLGTLLDGKKTKLGAILLAAIGIAEALGYPISESIKLLVGAYTANGIRDAISKVEVKR